LFRAAPGEVLAERESAWAAELTPNMVVLGPRNLIASVHPVLKCKSGDSGRPMPSHRFKIGDVVTLQPAISRNVPGGLT
jgi:hypothetical protein